MEQKNKVILLAGPTASGKSKLALKLARHLNGEIINADSMQIYKEISILNSKPNLKKNNITKHHLYGFCSVKKNFSTGHWLKMATKKIKILWKKGKTPIVVGGTGLYFKALTEGLVEIPEIPKNLRNKIRMMHYKVGQKKFFKMLLNVDPLAKKFILPSDSQRSIRAYEVKKYTKKSMFEFMKKTKSNFESKDFKKIFINHPKDLLLKKIEKRIDQMFLAGVVDEVKNFFKLKVNVQLSSNKIIGINEIKDYIHGNATLIKTKELISIKTRQYAKRQFTWARGHMKSWEMIYSTNIDDLYKKVINKIS